MFGMQQLKGPFCFCCALALLSSLICIFLQVGTAVSTAGWVMFLRHLPACAPRFKDQTRPAQELSRRMVASQAQTATPATLLSAKPSQSLSPGTGNVFISQSRTCNSRLKENGVWRFRWPLDLKGSCIILYSKSRVSWAPLFHQDAHDSPVMSSVGSSVPPPDVLRPRSRYSPMIYSVS